MKGIAKLIRTYGAMTLVVMALALTMGTLEFLRFLNMVSGANQKPGIGELLKSTFTPWLIWLAAAPVVAFCGQRVRPGTASWLRVGVTHILVGAVMGVGGAAMCAQVSPIIFGSGEVPRDVLENVTDHVHRRPVTIDLTGLGEENWPPEMTGEIGDLVGTKMSHLLIPEPGEWWFGPFASGLLTYAALVVVVMAFQLYRDVRERQAVTDHLEAQLAQAQLATLRMQIRPHFLFNTLSSIATLMPRDTQGARRMVNQLADLLRASFSEMKAHEAPLRDDVELLRSYLEIQQVRFGEKLRVQISVESDVHEALVPSFCLQPLVENAIVHGVGARPELGTINIRTSRHGGNLLIDVSDDGPGALDGDLFSKGVGLRNTRDRLAQLYGDRASLTIETSSTAGFSVRLSIPYHESPMDVVGT